MGRVTRNPIFRVCDQVRLNPAYSAMETCWSIETAFENKSILFKTIQTESTVESCKFKVIGTRDFISKYRKFEL